MISHKLNKLVWRFRLYCDTALDNTNGANTNISGTIDVANGSKNVTGINSFFTEELVVGDSFIYKR